MNFSEQSRLSIYRFFWRLCNAVNGKIKYQPWGALKGNNLSKFGTGYTKVQQSWPGVDCVAFPSRGGIYQPGPAMAPTIIAFLQGYFSDPAIVDQADPKQCRVQVVRMPQKGFPASASIEIRFVTDYWGLEAEFLISLSPTGILSLNVATRVSGT